jgi:hypothetical protein
MNKPYFYKIAHLKTGMIYVGVSFSKHCDSIKFLTESGYKTSSKLVHKLIQEDGLSSFKVELIKHYDNIEKLLQTEKRYLSFHYSILGRTKFQEVFLNRNFSKCFIKTDDANKKQSEMMIKNNPMFLQSSKEKIKRQKIKYWNDCDNRKNASKRTKEFFEEESNKIKHSDAVRTQWTKERKTKYSEQNPSKRQDVKDKVREKRLGMIWWNNGSIRTMSKTNPGPNWVVGYKIGEINESKNNKEGA